MAEKRDRPVRVVVHMGFHKTGTTSAQQFLRANGKHLWPVMALGLRQQLEPVLFASRAFSTWRDPFSLEKLRRRFGAYLGGLDLGRKRDLLLSSEELAGHMPGRDELSDYSAVPEIADVLEQGLKARFGDPEVVFFFTLRRGESWLESAHWEHVKSSRMVLDYPEFAAKYPDAGALEPVVEATRARLESKVETAWLEEIGGLHFGPATPLLDLMRLDPARRARLALPRHMNRRQHEGGVMETLLGLNRSDLGEEALKEAKDRVLGRS
ncbi:hypothetical protein [Vannielia sp.]|uniref:hypothetical protein n=1 Tax=Vannielia sp. TaxID=2813045 RepID=UPI00261A2E93|nr:hypothetical protein [Vannielia sp.]MDF1873890.1 hypothetical protein [Vannielia sp.]